MGERALRLWSTGTAVTEGDANALVRDAATVILVRDAESEPKVLMGQRGKSAVFMPEKVVFPGGAVDAADAGIALHDPVTTVCSERLAQQSSVPVDALATAAIREVFEETGLLLGRAGLWPEAPPQWTEFAAHGYRPDASALRFFFRAVTPPGRPRRFDARFFLADADALQGDIDDFSQASAELSDLRWVPLAEVRELNLAFITRLVLAELTKHLPSLDAPAAVPLVRNDALDRGVFWLG